LVADQVGRKKAGVETAAKAQLRVAEAAAVVVAAWEA
jgi:hypothetical protein